MGMGRRLPLRSPGDCLWTQSLCPLLGARNPQTKERNWRLPSYSLTRRASSGGPTRGQLTSVFSTAASDRLLLPRGTALLTLLRPAGSHLFHFWPRGLCPAPRGSREIPPKHRLILNGFTDRAYSHSFTRGLNCLCMRDSFPEAF